MTDTPLAPEIIWFNPSESYIKNPLNTLGGMSKSSRDRGLLCLHYGFQEQDPPAGVWIMSWHNLAAHQSFMEHESYVDFALPVMEAMVGSGEITQVLLSQQDEFLKAVASPVTQFIYITLRPRHDRNYELAPLVEKLANELTMVPGCHGSSWGPSVEQDDKYVGVIGWSCISDRDRSLKGNIASTIAQIREIGSVELKFARLRLHEPS